MERFTDRMEITNPGRPLTDPFRFIDEPPRSRHEAIVAVMRRQRSFDLVDTRAEAGSADRAVVELGRPAGGS